VGIHKVHTAQFKLTSEDYVWADVGKEVTLPCHLSPDTSAVATTIRWFKETECIYLYQNGQVTERSGYEGRVSLITQELERGNVSLRLRDCRESDTADYKCQVIHGEQKEEAAVGLWDREGNNECDEQSFQYDTSDTDPTLPLRRTNSMELNPPLMGGESSSPDSPRETRGIRGGGREGRRMSWMRQLFCVGVREDTS
uniref:Ig-like domain-containing protein n=1 Tax=Salmo trutta TaxID=8032 RepID=A0A673W5H0_SALTR